MNQSPEFGTPACTAGLDGSVATFTFTTTTCPHLLGESFPTPTACDVTGLPPGGYTLLDGSGRTSTLVVPFTPDSGLASCGF